MSGKTHFCGIDCGALFFKLVVLDDSLRKVSSAFLPHHGEPEKVLEEQLSLLPEDGRLYLSITGGPGEKIAENLGIHHINYVRAEVAYVGMRLPEARNIIHVGGANATWIKLNEKGEFESFQSNSLCAAGTGSFLDEQAGRLGIDYNSLDETMLPKEAPSIATRCAVFAKTDIIHFQQQGATPHALWVGLCRSMASTCLQTLFQGRTPGEVSAFTGGVSLNKIVLSRLRELLSAGVVEADDSHLSGAIGAALIAKEEGTAFKREKFRRNVTVSAFDSATQHRPELLLKKSNYPDSPYIEAFIDDKQNEVNVTYYPETSEIEGFLGVDIGSTSTKLAFLDHDGKVVVDIYRKTAGDPVGATQKIFSALNDFFSSHGVTCRVRGCGTTGSGRRMVGLIIGADYIINEISAHAAGAMNVDSSIDTIFEIGGQDSKYIRLENGNVVDSNMNYVCAAGTGSFIEELAHKLDLDLTRMGELVMGKAPPYTSERCTVFMEQDCHKLIRKGYSRNEVMGAILYSVAQNYLNRVVGKRYYSRERFFFQGATARNQALVAAFENLLDVEVVVSPYCGVMGSVGVALIVRDRLLKSGRDSSFMGLDLSSREIEFTQENCTLCQNTCLVTTAHIEGRSEKPSWGYMCGREPESKKMKQTKEYSLYSQRTRLGIRPEEKTKKAPVVGLPLALSGHSFMPFWQEFFHKLGVQTVVSKSDSKVVSWGGQLTGGDFCFPVKVALGHVLKINEERMADHICIPHMISARPDHFTSNNFFCPYLQSLPAVSRSALRINGIPDDMIMAPIVDLRWPLKRLCEELYQKCGRILNRDRSQVRNALSSALLAQRRFQNEIRAGGERELEELNRDGKIGLVIIGRPYSTMDPVIDLGLPRKLAGMGYTVFPVDTLPLPNEDPGSGYQNMYWHFPRRIMAALRFIKNQDNLYPVYLSNFNCGPDSFTLSYAEDICAGKPMLVLELDEHGADVGYMTRVEAFLDVVQYHHKMKSKAHAKIKSVKGEKREGEVIDLEERLNGRKVWVPQMHPISSRLGAAAFRGAGYNCEMLPPETRESFELGRRLTRGSECLPNALTIGSLMLKLMKLGEPGQKHAYFMPTADGPCRFGQYATLHRMVMEKMGFEDVFVFSPASRDTYYGVTGMLRLNVLNAFIVGDILTKMACRIRPYEIHHGTTDAILERWIRNLEQVFEENGSLDEPLRQAIDEMAAVPIESKRDKPLVGIVGEIYVRSNTFANEDVISAIEQNGGEAWLAPMCEWLLYSGFLQQYRIKEDYVNHRHEVDDMEYQIILESEKNWYKSVEPHLTDRHEPPLEEVLASGEKYLPKNFEGEAILTIGRALHFIYEGAAMVINCAPFGCMPGTISTSLFHEIQQQFGVPILNLFYDGEGHQNDKIAIFLSNLTASYSQPDSARMQRHEK